MSINGRYSDIIARLPGYLIDQIESQDIEEPIIIELMDYGLTDAEIGRLLDGMDRPPELRAVDIDAVIRRIRSRWQRKKQTSASEKLGNGAMEQAEGDI